MTIVLEALNFSPVLVGLSAIRKINGNKSHHSYVSFSRNVSLNNIDSQ